MNMFNKILIIDDDTLIHHLYQKSIYNFKISENIISKTNGKEAIDYLKDEQNLPFPYLIIVDYEMPTMDGIAFLNNYDKLFYEKYPNTIIVVSSNIGFISLKKKFINRKSVDYIISKPIGKDE